MAVQESAEQHSVTLKVDGKPLAMEINTRAASSVISEATCEKIWPHQHLMPSTVKLQTYSGKPLALKGSMTAQVRHGAKEAKLTDKGPLHKVLYHLEKVGLHSKKGSDALCYYQWYS